MPCVEQAGTVRTGGPDVCPLQMVSGLALIA